MMDGPHPKKDGSIPQTITGSEEEMMVGPHLILVQESQARVLLDRVSQARVQHL
jgi:hypothetical protein